MKIIANNISIRQGSFVLQDISFSLSATCSFCFYNKTNRFNRLL